MAEDLTIIRSTDKQEQYRSLIPQIEALLYGEPDLVANLANVCAALKEQFKWFWVGFYLVKNGELVLGPFRDRWPVPALPKVREFAVHRGNRLKRWWFRMWMPFLV